MKWYADIPDLDPEGFKHVGDGKIKLYKGGGGGTSTVSQVTIPKELVPFVVDAIKTGQKASALPYVGYSGQRIAGFTPEQRNIRGQVLNLRTPQEIQGAMRGAQGVAALGFGAAQQGLNRALNFRPGQFTVQNVAPVQLQKYQMSPVERATSEVFDAAKAQQYMSPYQQAVTDAALREANRAAGLERARINLASGLNAAAGTGTGTALERAELNRNMMTALGDIQAKGSQSAFENAQAQFERDQMRKAAAQQQNIASALTTGRTNLEAMLNVQQLGAMQSLDAQRANQMARLEAQRMAEQSRQYGAGLGAQIGTAGLGTSLSAAMGLGELAGAKQRADLARLDAQSRAAAAVQEQNQRILSQRYQDFLAQRGYPREMAAYYSDIVRGTGPLFGTVRTDTQPAPNSLSQIGGLLTGLFGASRGFGFAEGGEVESDVDSGLGRLALYNLTNQ